MNLNIHRVTKYGKKSTKSLSLVFVSTGLFYRYTVVMVNPFHATILHPKKEFK